MYNNESRYKGYKEPSELELLSLEKASLEKLDSIQNIISNKMLHRGKDFEYTIDFGHHRIENGRYPHPCATVKDIFTQKEL